MKPIKSRAEIAKILRDVDPVRLFVGQGPHPPEDEYAPEAEAIVLAVIGRRYDPSEMDLVEIIHEVFEHWFWSGVISRHEALDIARRLMK